ncbi:MAG: Mu transposase C-terminal domain-containing protein [Desulfotomaculales bacterium]
MEVRLTVAEAADLMGVSRQAVLKAIKAFNPVRDGNRWLIPLSALPAHAQNRYFEQQRMEQVQKAADGTNLAEIIEAEGQEIVTEALRREVFVRQALEYTGEDVTMQRQSLARMAGVSLATLYRWIASYQERGFMGILDGLRKTRESEGYGSKSFDPEALEFAKKLYLTSLKPTLAWVYERVQERAEQEGWKVGSYQSFCRAIKDMVSYAEEVMGREGVEAYRKKVMPKVIRRKPRLVNQVWVGDHHQLDFFIEHKGKLVRPWLTAWLDMTTAAFVGWCICLQPSSDTIALAFRHGVLPKAEPDNPLCGLPMEAYIDNGKDYRSDRLDAVFKALRIDVTYCEEYSPWSKPVERAFGTVADRFSRYAPGYIGNSPQNKPEKAFEKAQKLQKEGKLWTLEQTIQQFAYWLVSDYHTRIHSGIKTTPYDAFRKKPKARLDMPDPRALDILLMRADTRKVFDEGIKMQNFWYASPELWKLVGETVTVYYDPYRLGELVVYHKGEFACLAYNRELMEMGATQDDLKEFLAMRRRAQKELERQIKENNKTLEEVVEERRRAGARAGTTAVRADKPQVATLTGHEAAGKARAEASIPVKAGKRAKRNLADEYIKALAED